MSERECGMCGGEENLSLAGEGHYLDAGSVICVKCTDSPEEHLGGYLQHTPDGPMEFSDIATVLGIGDIADGPFDDHVSQPVAVIDSRLLAKATEMADVIADSGGSEVSIRLVPDPDGKSSPAVVFRVEAAEEWPRDFVVAGKVVHHTDDPLADIATERGDADE